MATVTYDYDKKQDFNSITRYLHSFRHVHVGRLARDLHRELGRPVRVLDVGCATGRAFDSLNAACPVEYTGIDVNSESIAKAQQRGAANATFKVMDASEPTNFSADEFDLVIALETLEHIPERLVVRIVENICQIAKPRRFVASVPVEIGPAIWIKYLGSKLMRYRRPHYSASEAFWAGLYQLNKVKTHEVFHVGFNWYWLEQTIRHNAKIIESRSLPWRWLPKWITPTVMFIAEPRPVSTGPTPFAR
jgi:SAM-dependent methyltransferase